MIRFENDILSYLAASIHRPHRVAWEERPRRHKCWCLCCCGWSSLAVTFHVSHTDQRTNCSHERWTWPASVMVWNLRYTYCILFPAIALTAFYFIDFSLKIWTALLSFSVLFFLWQRYVMLWLYGKSQFDSDTWKLTMQWEVDLPCLMML